MSQLVYILCALTSLMCTLLIIRSYRANHVGLLWWSAVCFSALTLANVLLFLDRIIYPSVDLRPLYGFITLVGLGALLYGLVCETT